jgi:CheY-like chemotaxis protein
MRILLVEDEADAAAVLATGLREHAYAVDVAGDGAQALQQAAFNDYDLIVLDRLLPGLDGVEVCGRLRADGLTTPILMLTARGDPEHRVEGLDGGADGNRLPVLHTCSRNLNPAHNRSARIELDQHRFPGIIQGPQPPRRSATRGRAASFEQAGHVNQRTGRLAGRPVDRDGAVTGGRDRERHEHEDDAKNAFLDDDDVAKHTDASCHDATVPRMNAR